MPASTDLKAPRIAEAGHGGGDIRSDLHVALEPRGTGGIEIELESRVAPYYGKVIRAQAKEVLAAMGVEHARVAIRDSGALPFVIAARVEAAVRRAGLGEGRRALPDVGGRPAPNVCSVVGVARAAGT